MLAWRCLGRCMRQTLGASSAASSASRARPQLSAASVTPCPSSATQAASHAWQQSSYATTGRLLKQRHQHLRSSSSALHGALATFAAQPLLFFSEQGATRQFSGIKALSLAGGVKTEVKAPGLSGGVTQAGNASIVSSSAEGDELADSNIIATAYHIGTELDMTAAAAEHRGGPQHIESDHCILWVPELKDSTDIFQPGSKSVTLPRRCIVLFPFGSVVFFGFGTGETELWLQALHRHVTGPLARPQYRREELKLEIRPQQSFWIQKGLDVIQLKRLNMATTRILSLVLAQSVALDTYMSKVDEALTRTVGILEGLTRENVKSMQRQGLMNLLCQNNLLYTTVITKLGVLDYSPLAWRQDRYYDVWKVLQEEYEITHRVNALERKVGPIQENVKFLLQLEHTKKTERSELIIIYLIFIEIVLTCVHIFNDHLAASAAAAAAAASSILG